MQQNPKKRNKELISHVSTRVPFFPFEKLWQMEKRPDSCSSISPLEVRGGAFKSSAAKGKSASYGFFSFSFSFHFTGGLIHLLREEKRANGNAKVACRRQFNKVSF